MIDLIVFDVGNTTVKAALFAGSEVAERGSFHHGDSGELDRLLRFVASAPADCVAAIAGVRESVTAPLVRRLGEGRTILVAPGDFQAPIQNDCHSPDSVGQDRLFNAAAAGVRHGMPAVVIDVGTAITVDRVDPPGRFCGGAIAAGPRLCFESLHRETGQLPLVEPGNEVPDALGTDTVGAIRSGVIVGLAGLVERLVRDLSAGDDPEVVLTGGDAALLLPLLGDRPRYDMDLTLHGIALVRATAFNLRHREVVTRPLPGTESRPACLSG